MLEIIIINIFIATLINIFLKRIGIPTIIGYILTGISVTYILNLKGIGGNEELKLIGEFGVVFLMFTIGLEFSIKYLIKLRKFVFLYGSLQFFITSIIFFIISYFFLGFEKEASIIIGSALSLSSTAIVLKVMNETKEINKRYGQRSLGILLFQDLAVIPILLMIGVFSSKSSNIGVLLGETILSALLLFLFLWFIGKYIIEIFLENVSKTKSEEVFIGAVLLIVFGSSYFAHYLGLSYSLGALIAGVMIAETHFKYQVESKLIPFRDLLLGVFFITVGMQLDFSLINENIVTISLFVLGIIFIKIFIIFISLIFFEHKQTSLKTALSLFQVGEFAIVIFELAKTENLIDNNLGQILTTVVIISMILTPFILKNIDFITKKIIGQNASEYIKTDELKNHIILVGYGRIGRMLSEFFDKNSKEHIIIEQDLKSFKKGKKEGKRVIFGDASDRNILKASGIKNVDFVIVSLGFGKDPSLQIKSILEYIDKSKLIVKVNTFAERDKLKYLDLPHLIVETEATANSIMNFMEKEDVG